MEYRLHDSERFSPVPWHQGHWLLSVEVTEIDAIHLDVRLQFPKSNESQATTSWISAKFESQMDDLGHFKIRLDPSCVTGPGDYLTVLRLGGFDLAILMRLTSAPGPGPCETAGPGAEVSVQQSDMDGNVVGVAASIPTPPGLVEPGLTAESQGPATPTSVDESIATPAHSYSKLWVVLLLLLPVALGAVMLGGRLRDGIPTGTLCIQTRCENGTKPPEKVRVVGSVGGLPFQCDVPLHNGSGNATRVPIGTGSVRIGPECALGSRVSDDKRSGSASTELYSDPKNVTIPASGTAQVDLALIQVPRMTLRTEPYAKVILTRQGILQSTKDADKDGHCPLGALWPNEEYVVNASKPLFAPLVLPFLAKAGDTQLPLMLKQREGILRVTPVWWRDKGRPEPWPPTGLVLNVTTGGVTRAYSLVGELVIPLGKGFFQLKSHPIFCSPRVTFCLKAKESAQVENFTLMPRDVLVIKTNPGAKVHWQLLGTRENLEGTADSSGTFSFPGASWQMAERILKALREAKADIQYTVTVTKGGFLPRSCPGTALPGLKPITLPLTPAPEVRWQEERIRDYPGTSGGSEGPSNPGGTVIKIPKKGNP